MSNSTFKCCKNREHWRRFITRLLRDGLHPNCTRRNRNWKWRRTLHIWGQVHCTKSLITLKWWAINLSNSFRWKPLSSIHFIWPTSPRHRFEIPSLLPGIWRHLKYCKCNKLSFLVFPFIPNFQIGNTCCQSRSNKDHTCKNSHFLASCYHNTFQCETTYRPGLQFSVTRVGQTSLGWARNPVCSKDTKYLELSILESPGGFIVARLPRRGLRREGQPRQLWQDSSL